METIAASLIQRAVEKDKQNQFTMALVLYQEGLQILIDSMKELKDPTKKKYFKTRAKEYMDRAEKIKIFVEEKKKTGQYSEHLKIENGATGYGYATVLGRFLDATVTQIQIDEPYLKTFHQCQNFLRFSELAVQKCQSLSKIKLTTIKNTNNEAEQLERLEELKKSLAGHLITLCIEFSETLHDRQIILSNGWVIKIGRGLDYFKPPGGKFVLGYCDLELRPCLETTIDIFHQTNIKNVN